MLLAKKVKRVKREKAKKRKNVGSPIAKPGKQIVAIS